MIKPGKPDNEPERLAKLQEYNILDTLPEREYDDLVRVAAHICNTPIALISLVDSDRQWFKAKLGLEAKETPRDISFCAYAILGEDVFTVPDATQDERFQDNPLVEGDPHVRFYAGAPLKTQEGLTLGTLCVIDSEANSVSLEQEQALEALARITVHLLDLHQELNLRSKPGKKKA